MTSPWAWEFDPAVLVLGALTGVMYGLLAVGLVLVYRANRVVNFAHGEIGAFGAALFSIMVVRWGLPYWLVLPVALAAAAAVGGAAEVVAVRRLRDAPALMSVVATLGIGQLLLAFAAAINPSAGAGITFPSPPWMPTFTIGSLTVTPAYSAMLILGRSSSGAWHCSSAPAARVGPCAPPRRTPRPHGSTASRPHACRPSPGVSPAPSPR